MNLTTPPRMRVRDLGAHQGACRIGLQVAGNPFVLIHVPALLDRFCIVSRTEGDAMSPSVAEGRTLEDVLARFATFLRGWPIRVELPISLMVELVTPTWRAQMDRWAAGRRQDAGASPHGQVA